MTASTVDCRTLDILSMIIDSKAPTRIDLAGGTLDLWPLYLFFESPLTLNLGIDLWASTRLEAVRSGSSYAVLKTEDQKTELKLPWDLILSDRPLEVPPQLELHAKLLRFFARKRNTPPQGMITLSTQAKSPAGAGLGGSSTLSVSLVGALSTWARDGEAPQTTTEGERFIEIVRDIETTVIKVPAGVQDYYGSMFGGLQALHWGAGAHRRESLPESTLKELEKRLLLFYSGQSRNSGINNWALFKAFIDGDQATREKFSAIHQATHSLLDALTRQDWVAVGNAIASEWRARRTLAPGITTETMDQAFEAALRLGASAGKVCGAGGGGCFFVYLPESADSASGAQKRDQIRTAIESLGVRSLPFKSSPRGLEVRVTRA
jgi:D-glycero-alpha-D-manno-heptose-7-phosphate kinase